MKKLLLALLACLLWSVSAGATITFVQANNASNTGSGLTSFTASGITTTGGNFVAVYVREGTNNTDNFTVTDSASQTWTQTASGYSSSSSTNRAGMFFIPNSAALTSITVNFTTGGGVANVHLVWIEFSGMATASAEDSSVNGNTNSALTTSTSGSLTTTNANDVLLFGTSVGSNQGSPFFTVGASYTLPTNGAEARVGVQYQIVSSTQSGVTTTMTYATAANNQNVFAGFKASSGGPTTPANQFPRVY